METGKNLRWKSGMMLKCGVNLLLFQHLESNLLILIALAFVGVRAFTTSQTAEAHLILFTRIFFFAELDTGHPVKFRHIHGEGFHVWNADAHKGQALG